MALSITHAHAHLVGLPSNRSSGAALRSRCRVLPGASARTTLGGGFGSLGRGDLVNNDSHPGGRCVLGARRLSTRLSASASASPSSASSSKRSDDNAAAAPASDVKTPFASLSSSTLSSSGSESARQNHFARRWWKAPAAALAIAAIIFAMPLDAQAARSGGRMGGGSFRSASPSVSRSSISGASGLGGGSSYRSPGMMASGGSMMAPQPGGMPMRSMIMPIPMGVGYGFGAPMMFMGGGGGIIRIAFVAVLALFFIDSIKNLFGGESGVQLGGDRIAVIKIQIGLLGLARDLQLDLEKIADKADTSSPDGLHYVLEETVLALLRNPEYCVYGFATTNSAKGPEEAEDLFNEMSMDERGKFSEETLSNVNARKRATSSTVAGEDNGINEYILVTIIAAADGNIKLPVVTDGSELRTALKRLGAIRVDALQAVEVLWTPQEEGDTLTEDELLSDYPQLNIL